MPKAVDSRHKVGVVRSIGDHGDEHQRAWVRCRRREASVPLEVCKSCASMIEIQRDRAGWPTSVICQDRPHNDHERLHDGAPKTGPRVGRLTVGDLMTRDVLCVRPDLSLDAVMGLFLESGFRALPVVDEAGALLGLVCESDVLIDVYARDRANDNGSPEVGRAFEPAHAKTSARTVGDVMTPIPFSLAEHVPVAQAAAVMAFEGIYHVTVISAEGKVVGILSAADILCQLAREEGYLVPRPQRVRP